MGNQSRIIMGKGSGEPCLFGKPIWGVLLGVFACAGIVCLIIGSVNLGLCSSAQSDCKDDTGCKGLCISQTGHSDCDGGCFDGRGALLGNSDDCDSSDWSNDSAKKWCKYVVNCSCNGVRGGIAAIVFCVIFFIGSCIC